MSTKGIILCASSSASLGGSDASRRNTPESDMNVEREATPQQDIPQSETNAAQSHSGSPSAAKRRRLEELAEERRKKKRV
jgi:hypothetical protein